MDAKTQTELREIAKVKWEKLCKDADRSLEEWYFAEPTPEEIQFRKDIIEGSSSVVYKLLEDAIATHDISTQCEMACIMGETKNKQFVTILKQMSNASSSQGGGHNVILAVNRALEKITGKYYEKRKGKKK